MLLRDIAPEDLEKRLLKVQEVTDITTAKAHAKFKNPNGLSYGPTGFISAEPEYLRKTLLDLMDEDIGDNPISIDLGCGTGTWTLMAAAAGIPSYGMDIEEYVVQRAERDLRKLHRIIEVDCQFATGNIYPKEYMSEYERFRTERRSQGHEMPRTEMRSKYDQFGVNIGDATIVYSYAWGGHVPFQEDFLERETKPNTIFILPRSGQEFQEHGLNIEPINHSVWRKAA